MIEKRRIRIGNQTAFSAPAILRPFEYAVAGGFDAFEWFPDKKSGTGWIEGDISRETRMSVRDIAVEHDISLSVHAPLQLNPLKSQGLERFSETFEFAKDIGASLLNIHLYTDEGIAAYVAALTPLIKLLAQNNIKLSIENTPHTTPEDFNELFARLQAGYDDLSHVGMCLDAGHANLCSATRNDYLRFVDLLGPHVPVIHMHMHENYGDYDSHLPIFTGPAGKDRSGVRGLMQRLMRRGFSGCIILEQWPIPEVLLDEARGMLLDIIRNNAIAQPARLHDFVSSIAEANRRFPSWRRRLQWIHDVLTDDAFEPTIEQLVYIAIYLRFIGAGWVPCGEDGGHYRPSHHARISRRIYRRLLELTGPENIFIIRKIYPWLPSFDGVFIRAEPLTLIRDLAHRNDIPRGLKQEIKTTLQNKLHRCAGPEDLAVSEALLKRITVPEADYPPSFVGEFRRFHEELREFFNARSLNEQLEALTGKGTGREAGLIRDFIRAKEDTGTIEQMQAAFDLLTGLRNRFNERFMGDADAEAQRFQTADIRLEDFSFVLLSRMINYLEAVKDNVPWDVILRCIETLIENLRLSGFDNGECQALGSELKAWSHGFDPRDREYLLCLISILHRCRRLADIYINKILTLFPEKAEGLGRVLGVAEHNIRVFSEADIRSHPVFQLSRLITFLLKRIRAAASLQPWDAVVPGKIPGRLTVARSIAELSAPPDGPVLAVLEKIEGDEEIPPDVAGIISAHEIPHLSHIAVRARQRNILFAVCEDEDMLKEIKAMAGRRLLLNVSPEKVEIGMTGDRISEEGLRGELKAGQVRVELPEVVMSPLHRLIPLDQVTFETGGGKAYASRRLEELSRLKGSGFNTPPGLVVPFGVMEESLHYNPDLEKQYCEMVDRLDHTSGKDFTEVLNGLRHIVLQLRAPDEIVSGTVKMFIGDRPLIVRSSSNCEDLEGFAGAGLYDSVAAIPAQEVLHAVSTVWSSLWNKRAAIDRKYAGIPQDKAHMAVLIQQMITPEFSFIMHTVNPVNNNPDEVYMELAVGLGETLTSGKTPGNPYRMACNKHTSEVRILAFAGFSNALLPDNKGGIMHKTVDYSTVRLSNDKIFRHRMGSRLCGIGRFVEEAFGRPQDIEGLFFGDTIFLVQSRPQQGGVL